MKGELNVTWELEEWSPKAALCLRQLGIRTSSKGYRYLHFALTHLEQNTPFQNSIWDLTAIYFNEKRENVLSCIRREISRAFTEDSGRFSYEEEDGEAPVCPPGTEAVLRLLLYKMRQADDRRDS